MVLHNPIGYASLKTTMDRYVHVTAASLHNAIKHSELNTSLASQKKWCSMHPSNPKNQKTKEILDI